tara:strand:+ start:303 stop:530 length:228 start_codon:yes stop_codon:yes gene_type:complete
MKKNFLFIIIILLLNTSITLSEIQDCNEFDKLSKKYLKCQKDNLLYKSEESGLTENVNDFKSSNTLSEFLKKKKN